MEAPSFAQMDNALSSLRTSTQDKSQVPTNQFLLNFIWINIKVCNCYSLVVYGSNSFFLLNELEACILD